MDNGWPRRDWGETFQLQLQNQGHWSCLWFQPSGGHWKKMFSVWRSPTCMYNIWVIMANRTKSNMYCQRSHKWISMDWLRSSGDWRGEGRASVWPRWSSLHADINSCEAMSLLSPRRSLTALFSSAFFPPLSCSQLILGDTREPASSATLVFCCHTVRLCQGRLNVLCANVLLQIQWLWSATPPPPPYAPRLHRPTQRHSIKYVILVAPATLFSY